MVYLLISLMVKHNAEALRQSFWVYYDVRVELRNAHNGMKSSWTVGVVEKGGGLL